MTGLGMFVWTVGDVIAVGAAAAVVLVGLSLWAAETVRLAWRRWMGR